MQNSMDLFTLGANLFYSNAIVENFHLVQHICEQLGKVQGGLQLTRGTLYPLNCPDQERIKSANVHHSILANGVSGWYWLWH